jgi:hypothetical protein
MAPLTALTGLYAPQPSVGKGDGHTESQGGPVGPGFGVRDPQVPFAYWAGPPPNEEQVFGSPLAADAPGIAPLEGDASLIDTTPGESPSHAAPYPRQAIPGGNTHDAGDMITEQEARRAIKGISRGGPEKVRTNPEGNIAPATWDYGGYVSSGESLLDERVGDQMKSDPIGGSGNAKNRIDAAQGFGQLGGYGSGAAHVQRSAMIDPVPGNWQWLNSSDRPIMVPRRGYQASFDGQDSPYGALGDTSNDMQQGADNAAVMTSPTPYNDPPNPAMGLASQASAEAPMVSSWF